jgi:hypothetical protein
MVGMDPPDLKALLVPSETKDPLETSDRSDRLESQSPDPLDLKGLSDPSDLKDPKDLRPPQVSLDPKALLDQEESLGLKESGETLV